MSCATVADERRAWGSLPKEVHEALVRGYEKTGVSPPAQVIAEDIGSSPSTVSRVLKGLCADGLIAQPYGGRSGYIPLYRPDGTRVKPVLVATGEEVPRGSSEEKSAVELLREALRKMEGQGEEN
jgi:DNA-binding Lrp family transcriptional regulator